jgi:hypothetical protein
MSALCNLDSNARAFIGDNGWAFVDSARWWFRHDRRSTLEKVFERDPELIAQERYQNVSFDARLQLMEQRPNRQRAFQRAKGGFGFGQLRVLRPQLFSWWRTLPFAA